jgi:hypothetical protein
MASKAAAAREYITANPNAKAKDVVEALKVKKITISAAQVYGLMSAKPVKKATKAGGFDDLIAAKKLVDAIGGVDKARSALNVLAQLLS